MAHGPLARARGRVLVVAEDAAVAAAVTAQLAREGCTAAYATDGFTALERAAEFRPQAVVLDGALPGIDALGLRHRLGRGGGGDGGGGGRAVPVIPLAGGPERGGGGERDVVARVGAALRQGAGGAPAGGGGRGLRVGDLSVEPGSGRVVRAGREVTLERGEFELLVFLMRHPGRVFSREQLLRRVWGRDFGDLAAVAVRVNRLRAKLAVDPSAPPVLTEVWGSGYRFDPGGGDVVGAGAGGGGATGAQDGDGGESGETVAVTGVGWSGGGRYRSR
ncbi:hypothetical protein ADL22_13350 [Streptomyces sp. NRRL F-4489]|nr:hypothetical protein ADL22_13350 [Streptomyces sp. NRRL F-4489]